MPFDLRKETIANLAVQSGRETTTADEEDQKVLRSLDQMRYLDSR
jgi:hypothetical protein